MSDNTFKLISYLSFPFFISIILFYLKIQSEQTWNWLRNDAPKYYILKVSSSMFTILTTLVEHLKLLLYIAAAKRGSFSRTTKCVECLIQQTDSLSWRDWHILHVPIENNYSFLRISLTPGSKMAGGDGRLEGVDNGGLQKNKKRGFPS